MTRLVPGSTEVQRPRMPRWFIPIWGWAGKVDDLVGRLRVLRTAAVVALALSVILGIFLINSFGPWVPPRSSLPLWRWLSL